MGSCSLHSKTYKIRLFAILMAEHGCGTTSYKFGSLCACVLDLLRGSSIALHRQDATRISVEKHRHRSLYQSFLSCEGPSYSVKELCIARRSFVCCE